MPDTDSSYVHPKSYANTRGGCSTTISGEHYISHALIRLYTFDDPDVRIQPTPNYRIPVGIQPRRFVANVLCTAHNNGLSDADSAALAFATFLRSIALRYMNGAGTWGEPEEVEVSGEDFQRWVLKLLITHAAADVFTGNNGERVTTVSDEAIDLLLDRAGWPSTWGLGVTGDLSNTHLSFDPFTRIETVTSDWCSAATLIKHDPKLLFGGVVELAGVSFTLCLFNQSEALLHDDEINPLRRVTRTQSHHDSWSPGEDSRAVGKRTHLHRVGRHDTLRPGHHLSVTHAVGVERSNPARAFAPTLCRSGRPSSSGCG